MNQLGIRDDVSYALNATDVPAVCYYEKPTAFTVSFCDANGASKSTNGKVRTDRPNGGLYINEVDKTGGLTAGAPISPLIVVEPISSLVGSLMYSDDEYKLDHQWVCSGKLLIEYRVLPTIDNDEK